MWQWHCLMATASQLCTASWLWALPYDADHCLMSLVLTHEARDIACTFCITFSLAEVAGSISSTSTDASPASSDARSRYWIKYLPQIPCIWFKSQFTWSRKHTRSKWFLSEYDYITMLLHLAIFPYHRHETPRFFACGCSIYILISIYKKIHFLKVFKMSIIIYLHMLREKNNNI